MDRNLESVGRREALAALGAASVGPLGSGCLAPTQSLSDERFSIAILPDTQHYSRLNNGIFEQQTRWIAANRRKYSIRAVLHLGDLVHNPDERAEWNVATTAIDTLDAYNIPTLLALGNHDATTIREPSEFRERFPSTRYSKLVSSNGTVRDYGTFDDSPENAYVQQVINGQKVLYITLEFGPRQAVVDWAHEVISSDEDSSVFVTTHSYMYFDDTRTDTDDDHNPRQYGLKDVHNGEELWEEFVSKHDNIVNVHSGHHIPENTGYRMDQTDNGANTAQMFANYQSEAKGGMGWLRLFTVDPSNRTIHVRTYSPLLDRWSTASAEAFTVSL